MLRSRCEALGIVDEITLFDGAPDEWLECYRVVQCAGIWQTLGPWISATRPRFGDAVAPRFAEASSITPAEIARLLKTHRGTVSRIVSQARAGV